MTFLLDRILTSLCLLHIDHYHTGVYIKHNYGHFFNNEDEGFDEENEKLLNDKEADSFEFDIVMWRRGEE